MSAHESQERSERKRALRARFGPYFRDEIAVARRMLGSSPDETLPKQLEQIRAGIKAKFECYLKLVADPPDAEHIELSMEVFDEVVDELKAGSMH